LRRGEALREELFLREDGRAEVLRDRLLRAEVFLRGRAAGFRAVDFLRAVLFFDAVLRGLRRAAPFFAFVLATVRPP
jgi:hypothetical protein